MNFKKRLGQNFLKNQSILEKTADLIFVEKPDFIVEIGAGSGALTEKLLEAKIPILAVEIDSYWYEKLKNKFSHFSHIRIIHADIIKLDWKNLSLSGKVAFVGNLPFKISTPIFFKILKNLDLFDFFVMMFQKEFADRIIASKKSSTKNFGSLGILAKLFFHLEENIFIARKNFYPIPKVDAILLKMKKTGFQLPDLEGFFMFLRCLFLYPRKTLWNNLKFHYSLQLESLSSEQKKLFQQVRASHFTALEVLELHQLFKQQGIKS